MYNRMRVLLMSIFLLTGSFASGAVVIFDLGGVLFRYNKRDVLAVLHGRRHETPFYPIAEGIALVNRCRAQLDALGARRHALYVLSNFSRESFIVLQRFHQPVLDLFDGIVISSHVGYAKPDQRIYEYVLRTYHLKPADCIFIDDELCKAHAATRVGMHGIVCRDFAVVERELHQLGVF